MKTTFSFKHKALDVYESSLAHFVDKVSINPDSAYPPSFVRLAQKNREPTNTSTNHLQSHKSQNTLKYSYINAVEW